MTLVWCYWDQLLWPKALGFGEWLLHNAVGLNPTRCWAFFLISFIPNTYSFFVCTSGVCNTGDFCLIRCLAVEPRADMHGINPKQFFEISLCGGQKSSTSWQLRLRVLWNAFLPHTGTFKNKLKLMNSPRVSEFYWFVCWSVTCWLRNIFQKLWWNKAEESH